jgi:4-aminobutyrate aminotransferase
MQSQFLNKSRCLSCKLILFWFCQHRSRIVGARPRVATTSKSKTFVTKSHQELQDFAAKHMAHGVARTSNIVLERGVGSHVYDIDGNKYLDFTCGIAVTSTGTLCGRYMCRVVFSSYFFRRNLLGHCHPRVVKAAQEQCAKMIHSQINTYYHQPLLELTNRMLKHLPSNIDRVFYANSGAEAVENSVKIARAFTKKQNIVVMDGGFHGRTLGALALTTSKNVYRAGFGPLPSGVTVAPYPYCYRCPTKNCQESTKNDPGMFIWRRSLIAGSDDMPCVDFCCNSWEAAWKDLFQKQTSASEVAAVLIEPILGEGGYVVPPKSFMKWLRKFCTDNKILLIADEVQSGFLRTGKWWGFEHFDIVPDIVVIAKGIASGFPLSAVASTTEIMQACAPGTLGGTYTGNAVACAAAIATIDVLEVRRDIPFLFPRTAY